MKHDRWVRWVKLPAATGGMFIGAVILFVLSGCGGSDTYSISGKATVGGSALPGVTITLTGSASGSTTTDAAGNYRFSDVESGTSTVTPSLAGYPYTFRPFMRNVYLSGIDATDFNFRAIVKGKMAATTHTVYVKTDGTLWAWGRNSDGQLGNGTTTDSATPVQVSGVANVTNIAAGYDHTVALKNDGTVWTWGNNSNGQLGNGNTTSSTTPVQATGLADVIAIAAGNKFSLAVKNDGTVRAWGSNSSGQLGIGNTTDSANPVQVSGLGNVTDIAAGSAHAVALISNGTVWAWGSNSNGQLGYSDPTNLPYSAAIVQVSGISDIMAIATGDKHTVALKNEYRTFTVWTWGMNGNGQLGNGTTTDSWTPLQVGGLKDVADIAAGYDHTIALHGDGTVWAWGNNSNGQLGTGNTTSSTTPVQASGISGAMAIATGTKETAVLKNDDILWAWGNNLYGQLGDGTTTDRLTAVEIVQP